MRRTSQKKWQTACLRRKPCVSQCDQLGRRDEGRGRSNNIVNLDSTWLLAQMSQAGRVLRSRGATAGTFWERKHNIQAFSDPTESLKENAGEFTARKDGTARHREEVARHQSCIAGSCVPRRGVSCSVVSCRGAMWLRATPNTYTLHQATHATRHTTHYTTHHTTMLLQHKRTSTRYTTHRTKQHATTQCALARTVHLHARRIRST